MRFEHKVTDDEIVIYIAYETEHSAIEYCCVHQVKSSLINQRAGLGPFWSLEEAVRYLKAVDARPGQAVIAKIAIACDALQTMGNNRFEIVKKFKKTKIMSACVYSADAQSGSLLYLFRANAARERKIWGHQIQTCLPRFSLDVCGIVTDYTVGSESRACSAIPPSPYQLAINSSIDRHLLSLYPNKRIYGDLSAIACAVEALEQVDDLQPRTRIYEHLMLLLHKYDMSYILHSSYSEWFPIYRKALTELKDQIYDVKKLKAEQTAKSIAFVVVDHTEEKSEAEARESLAVSYLHDEAEKLLVKGSKGQGPFATLDEVKKYFSDSKLEPRPREKLIVRFRFRNIKQNPDRTFEIIDSVHPVDIKLACWQSADPEYPRCDLLTLTGHNIQRQQQYADYTRSLTETLSQLPSLKGFAGIVLEFLIIALPFQTCPWQMEPPSSSQQSPLMLTLLRELDIKLAALKPNTPEYLAISFYAAEIMKIANQSFISVIGKIEEFNRLCSENYRTSLHPFKQAFWKVKQEVIQSPELRAELKQDLHEDCKNIGIEDFLDKAPSIYL